jgi:hypothetical protein
VRCRAACALALLLAPALSHAHQNSISYLDLRVRGAEVMVEVRIAAVDLNEAIGAPSGITLTEAQGLAGATRAVSYVSSRLTLQGDGLACSPSPGRAAVAHRREGWELVVSVPYRCARFVDTLTGRYALFFDVDPRHSGLATVHAHGRDHAMVFTTDARGFRVASGRSLAQQLRAYLLLGVEHILHGYDHVAFVVGLLLSAGAHPVRRALREVAAVVTSFTVAHSITLALSVLGWVTMPASVVEPIIALSIGFVAAQNLLVQVPRHRWALTFGFGLVHGFGFAGALAEQGLPARAFAASLISFNLGVEAGQLVVVGVTLPLIVLLTTQSPVVGRWLRRSGSVLLLLLSLFWLVERLRG